MGFQKKILSKSPTKHNEQDPRIGFHIYFIFLKLVISTEFCLHIFITNILHQHWNSLLIVSNKTYITRQAQSSERNPPGTIVVYRKF